MPAQLSNDITLTLSKERFRAITNLEYVPIKIAGKGQHGTVWYAIPGQGVAGIDQYEL